MLTVFRTDASLQIGSGHVMRCLTLADALRQKGSEVVFVCRPHPGNLIDLITGRGYSVRRLSATSTEYTGQQGDVAHAGWLGSSWQQDADETLAVLNDERADWLVVDHYALDARWESKLRRVANKIMVIDDLADRRHDCDLMLDQNLYEELDRRYDGLVPLSCRKLLGPKYALLRDEFRIAKKSMRARDGVVRRILVFFGGVDPTNETLKALDAIGMIKRPDIAVDVVVGATNPNRHEIEQYCRDFNWVTYHCQVNNIAELMGAADLAVGGGGTATWERCILGLPSITAVVASNQEKVSRAVAKEGAIILIGSAESTTATSYAEILNKLLCFPEEMVFMSRRANLIMGECSNRSLVADAIMGSTYV